MNSYKVYGCFYAKIYIIINYMYNTLTLYSAIMIWLDKVLKSVQKNVVSFPI